MSNTDNDVNQSITIESDNASITTTNKTNHKQILLMQNDWEFIKSKVSKIKFNTFPFNPTEIVVGAFISCAIQFFSRSDNGQDLNGMIICVLAIIFFEGIKKFPFIKKKWNFSDTSENILHVDDIKETISRIDNQNLDPS